MIDAPHRRLRAVLRLYLTQQALYMNFDGRFRYVEVARNVLVGAPCIRRSRIACSLADRPAVADAGSVAYGTSWERVEQRRQFRRSLLRGFGLQQEFDLPGALPIRHCISPHGTTMAPSITSSRDFSSISELISSFQEISLAAGAKAHRQRLGIEPVAQT